MAINNKLLKALVRLFQTFPGCAAYAAGCAVYAAGCEAYGRQCENKTSPAELELGLSLAITIDSNTWLNI